MKSKTKIIHICSQCGYETSKWMGKCPGCGEWNTLNEEVLDFVKNSKSSSTSNFKQTMQTYKMNDITDQEEEDRYLTGLSELDRVMGGGIVKGSLTLLSGEPGIGKSTILLQICDYLSKKLKVFYISGEESVRQVKLRAKRFNINSDNLFLSSENNILNIANSIRVENPHIVIIDSIQTMNLDVLSSSNGSITQVRECSNILMDTAKSEEVAIFLVGHVNKDGGIAGPKVLEHMVDTVLYFEGDRSLSYRILRVSKNRYGRTNEIGVFDMTDEGLKQIKNPSELFLIGKPLGVPGTCVACFMEGTRPILAEVQALVAKTSFPSPRRASTGFDYNRLNLLLAVLEKRCGYYISSLDVYVNVVGGLRLYEPAIDLPVLISVASSLSDKVIDDKIISFGEVGLTGEVRSVMNPIDRVLEAQRLGFTKCILPYNSFSKMSNKKYDIELIGVKNLKEVFYKLGF